MNAAVKRLLLLAGALAAACGARMAQAQLPPADHVVPSWWMGVPVLVHAYETRQRMPDAPFNPHPEVLRAAKSASVHPVYITAPLSETSPHSAERPITRMDGKTVTVPAHQATLSHFPHRETPAETIAYFVLPGTEADVETVRTAARPENSWAEGPLVQAIRIGGEWILLDSHLAVQYGLKRGLLRLQFFDKGSLMWAEFDTPEVSCDAACIQVKSLPPLPAAN